MHKYYKLMNECFLYIVCIILFDVIAVCNITCDITLLLLSGHSNFYHLKRGAIGSITCVTIVIKCTDVIAEVTKIRCRGVCKRASGRHLLSAPSCPWVVTSAGAVPDRYQWRTASFIKGEARWHSLQPPSSHHAPVPWTAGNSWMGRTHYHK